MVVAMFIATIGFKVDFTLEVNQRQLLHLSPT